MSEIPLISPEEAEDRSKAIIEYATLNPERARKLAHHLLASVLASVESGKYDSQKLAAVTLPVLDLIGLAESPRV